LNYISEQLRRATPAAKDCKHQLKEGICAGGRRKGDERGISLRESFLGDRGYDTARRVGRKGRDGIMRLRGQAEGQRKEAIAYGEQSKEQ
jgi:hypothetical protein